MRTGSAWARLPRSPPNRSLGEFPRLSNEREDQHFAIGAIGQRHRTSPSGSPRLLGKARFTAHLRHSRSRSGTEGIRRLPPSGVRTLRSSLDDLANPTNEVLSYRSRSLWYGRRAPGAGVPRKVLRERSSRPEAKIVLERFNIRVDVKRSCRIARVDVGALPMSPA